MSFNLTGGNPRLHRIRVYYEGTDTIYEGMPLCYNYLTTDNWHGGSMTLGAVTENNTTAEGSQNEGKYIRVIEPITIDIEEVTPGTKTITSGTDGSDELDFNNVKVGHWVNVSGTDVTNGTYKVTAVTQGTTAPSVASTITLDMDDATGVTADVRITANNAVWHAGAVAKGSPGIGLSGPSAVDVYVPNGAIVSVRTDKSCTIGESLGLGSDAYSAATGDSDPLPCAVCMETVDRSSASGLILVKLFDTSNLQQYFQPVRGADTGYVYGLQVDGTKILRGVGVSKSYVMQVSGTRESGYVATGDSNDAILKIQGSNYGACDTNYYFRGLNCSVANRSGGTCGTITNTISVSLKQGSTAAKAIALEVDVQDLAATAKTEFGGIDLAINREGTAATTEYGMQIRTRGTINTAINSVFRVVMGAADYGFTYLFNFPTAAASSIVAATGNVTTDASDFCIPIRIVDTTYYLLAVDSIPAG